jgi:hypothetical protein
MREEIRLTGIATPRFPHATLDAGGHRRVLTVRDGGVIRSLRIRHGRAPSGGGIAALGGVLELRGSTEVVANRAGGGGGIYAYGGEVVMLDSSTVRANVGGPGGGIFVEYTGGLVMRDRSSVRGNFSRTVGGGIYVSIMSVTMTGFSSVTGNVARSDGGGIMNDDGWTFFRNHARVTGNMAGPLRLHGEPGPQGGGVYVLFGSGGVCSRWVKLSPNTPDDPPDWHVGC